MKYPGFLQEMAPKGEKEWVGVCACLAVLPGGHIHGQITQNNFKRFRNKDPFTKDPVTNDPVTKDPVIKDPGSHLIPEIVMHAIYL